MSGMLEGKIALVTGGRGGIGSAICERFSNEGAQVCAGDLSEAGSLSATSHQGHFVRLDVTSETEVQAVLAAIEVKFGRLDVLVNAAGIELEKTIEETTLAQWNRIFAVNVTGTFLVCKYALPLLRRGGGGSIINFGSYDGFIADPGLAAYCATKGAVHALTRAMACDHGPQGIRVNAICPGYVDTPMLRSFFRDHGDIGSLGEKIRAIHPTRTYGTPADVANLANWLASNEARYASGQLWVLDGGLSAQVQQMRL
ncbi:MAG: SDR family oxidoreductase [Sinobacteraceae bacterium]|nr:SDR family oxidoreductase [Nevskiaceae bacterium]